jgi:hypothetical protein
MGRERGKARLRRTQFKLAETNVAMAIWLGKQLLGQRDRIEQEHSGKVDVNHQAVVDYVRRNAIRVLSAS